METMQLGKTNTVISRVGLGTWAIGGGPAWGNNDNEKESIETIQKCPSLGVNLIDTAPGYNFGNSEKIVGKALSEKKREDFIIITKCGLVWNKEGSPFNKVGDVQLYKNLSAESIFQEVEESLTRLDTEYIDVYMTHWQSVPPFITPISETMKALNELKKSGKIRCIGLANASVGEIKEYLKYGDVEIVQGKYSILDRQVEEELLPLCKEKGITLQAYSPLEQGLLSGTMNKDYQPVGAQIGKKWFQPTYLPKVIDMLNSWQPLTKKYNCTLANLALAWVLNQAENISILSGATTEAQIVENVRASEIKLADEDVSFMRQSAEEAEKQALLDLKAKK